MIKAAEMIFMICFYYGFAMLVLRPVKMKKGYEGYRSY